MDLGRGLALHAERPQGGGTNCDADDERELGYTKGNANWGPWKPNICMFVYMCILIYEYVYIYLTSEVGNRQ